MSKAAEACAGGQVLSTKTMTTQIEGQELTMTVKSCPGLAALGAGDAAKPAAEKRDIVQCSFPCGASPFSFCLLLLQANQKIITR